GGYMFLDPGSQDLGPKDAPFFGARYDLRLTGPISIEAELAYASSERAVRDTVPGETGLVTIGTVDQRFLLASAALRFDITGPRTYRRLQPFLRATGGFAFGLGDG